MSSYNWCHNPDCHTIETQSRVRGTGDNKVLRTVKIKQGRYGSYQANIWDFFCNHSCLMNYMEKHTNEVVAIAPVNKPQETPIEDPKKERQEGWSGRIFYNTKITRKDVDNN